MASDDVIEISDYSALPEKPIISVLMITYNHEQYIHQAIEGALAQETNFPFELVIGEDCSTDGTRSVIEAYQEKYPDKIRLIYSKRNVGANRNFSRTYACCRGKYIAICEGDDYWGDSNKLDIQLKFLLNNQKYVASYHDAITIDQDGNLLSSSKIMSITDMSGQDYPEDKLIRYSFMPTLTICFRKVLAEFPDEFYKVTNADTFIISLLGNYGSAHYHPEIKPATYLKHSGGVWSSLAHNAAPIKLIETYYWLAVYYKRVGKAQISNHFINGAQTILWRYNSECFLKKLRVFICTNSSLYRKLRRLWIS